MLESVKLSIRTSELRSRINGIQREPDPTDEQRADRDRLAGELESSEVEYRAALGAEDRAADVRQSRTPDAADREAERIRGECRASAFIFDRGRLSGAEAEFAAACGVGDGIPLALFDAETRGGVEMRADAATDPPATGGGVNLGPIQPAIFADSLAPRLGIDMPTVESGVFSTATITTSLTAGAKAKGGAAESTAAVLTAQTSSVKRISARLSLRAEDRASVGADNFDAALRQNLGAVLADAFDNAAVNGDGIAPNPAGLFKQLTDADAEDTADTWATFASKQASVIDGLWARTLRDVYILAGVDTYKHAAALFRGSDDSTSAAEYLTRMGGGFETHKRMPVAAAMVQAAIAYRRGRPGLRSAVMPIWNRVSIDDVFTDSASAVEHVTLHVLAGDVLIVQPGAYAELSFKVA